MTNDERRSGRQEMHVLAQSGGDRVTQMFMREPEEGPHGFVFAMPCVAMSADNLTYEIIRDGSARHGWIRLSYEQAGRRYVGEGPTDVAATLAVLADRLGYHATIVSKVDPL